MGEIGEGWDDLGGELDLAVPDHAGPAEKQEKRLAPGESPAQQLLKTRKLCVDLVLAGQFDEALDYLKRRIGLCNAKPLYALFRTQYIAGVCSVPGLPQTPSTLHMLMEGGLPRLLYTPQKLGDMVESFLSGSVICSKNLIHSPSQTRINIGSVLSVWGYKQTTFS